MSRNKRHQDPIYYLRAARGSGDTSLDDLRRTDSDDDLCAYSINGRPRHPTDTIPSAAAANATAVSDDVEDAAAAIQGTSIGNDHHDEASSAPSPSAQNNGHATDSTESTKPPLNGEFPPKLEPRKAYRLQSVGAAEEEPPARARPDVSQAWPYRETLSFTRSLVFYGAGSITTEHEQACASIQTARTLRHTYFGGKGVVMADQHEIVLKDRKNLSFRIGNEGVAEIYHSSDMTKNLIQVPNVERFQTDYHRLVELTSEGTMRSFCFQRLQILSTSFKMHATLNSTVEMEEQSNLLGNDFYRTMKVSEVCMPVLPALSSSHTLLVCCCRWTITSMRPQPPVLASSFPLYATS
jgi:AMP deaminase